MDACLVSGWRVRACVLAHIWGVGVRGLSGGGSSNHFADVVPPAVFVEFYVGANISVL